ncbi:hypothetical protein AAE478_001138 [Parahypoxylon ruwenzoriense]
MATLTKSARDNFAVCVFMLTLATASVLVRFLTRLSHHHTLLAADWMCLASLCLFAVYCALIIDFIFNVSQFHALDVNPAFGLAELVNLSKTAFIAEIFFGTSLTSIKLSILWFYHTLFSVNDTMLRVTRGTAILCVMWYITVTFIIVFQCNPISAYWDSVDSPLYCMSSPRVLLGYEMSNLFLDVIILCIPVTIVPRLHLSTPKKATVLGIFLLGALQLPIHPLVGHNAIGSGDHLRLPADVWFRDAPAHYEPIRIHKKLVHDDEVALDEQVDNGPAQQC